MGINWCPNNYISYLQNLGEVNIIKDTIHFNYGGLKLIFNAKDEIEIFNEIFLKDEYKIDIKRNSVVIDIGANVGIATLYFALNNYVSKVYSYEPFELTYNCLTNNLLSNPGLSNKININNVGLGAEDKVSKCIINDLYKGNSSTREYEEIPQIFLEDEGNCKIQDVIIKKASKIIKDIIDENKDKDIIIKMDCEGAEQEIFNDWEFTELLKDIKAIVMETHNNMIYTDIYHILQSKGFNVEGNMVSVSNGYIKASKN